MPSLRIVPALLALTLPSLARADLPAPEGYVESCTVAAHQRPGRECTLCGDAYHGDPDACRSRYEAPGYEKACQTAGASTWDEVWCRDAATAGAEPLSEPAAPVSNPIEVAPAPTTSSKSGSPCSITGDRDAPGGLLALVTLVLAAASRRRRR